MPLGPFKHNRTMHLGPFRHHTIVSFCPTVHYRNAPFSSFRYHMMPDLSVPLDITRCLTHESQLFPQSFPTILIFHRHCLHRWLLEMSDNLCHCSRRSRRSSSPRPTSVSLASLRGTHTLRNNLRNSLKTIINNVT